jgi:hypothetical protein
MTDEVHARAEHVASLTPGFEIVQVSADHEEHFLNHVVEIGRMDAESSDVAANERKVLADETLESCAFPFVVSRRDGHRDAR